MINSYPQEVLQRKCLSIVENVLKEKYVKLSVNNFILKEKKKTNIECDISFSNEWETTHIKGSGYGVVDTLFTAMVEKFSKDFFSLGKVSFDDFIMEVKFKSNIRKSASPVGIKIALKMRLEKIYIFLLSRAQW